MSDFDRPANDLGDIQITPAMIEAGVEVLRESQSGTASLEFVAREVYTAMARLSLDDAIALRGSSG